MKKNDVYEELLKVSKELGISIRHERGFFNGGSCNVNGDECVVLNERHTVEKKINILAREISELELEPNGLHPKVRKILENEKKNLGRKVEVVHETNGDIDR